MADLAGGQDFFSARNQPLELECGAHVQLLPPSPGDFQITISAPICHFSRHSIFKRKQIEMLDISLPTPFSPHLEAEA